MKILVINAGSSSLKYQLIDMDTETILARGNCERIGFSDGLISYCPQNKQVVKRTSDMKNHTDAFHHVVSNLLDEDNGVISKLSEISAIGHRIVQGGATFKESVVIDEDVIREIEKLIPLAPLHNSAHVQAIKACFEVFGKSVPEIAVFDTSFYSTIPPKAYVYPIPYEYLEKYNVRKYGFHGTSHRYVSRRCSELMNEDISSIKLITCHLGNGSSITAINRGRVIDTSMGLTPLDGLIMGTRCGSIDPSVVTFISEQENLTAREINDILNKKSGLLGISGISNDIRDINLAAQNGNSRAILAQEILKYQIVKFIGSYTAAMNGLDAVVFTGGIGENYSEHRLAVCNCLSYFGISIDKRANQKTINGKEACISSDDSKVKIFVIPTNEEIVIARDTVSKLSK